MKKDLTDLKKLVVELISKDGNTSLSKDQTSLVNRFYNEVNEPVQPPTRYLPPAQDDDSAYSYPNQKPNEDSFEVHEEVEESLSLEDTEREMIKKALTKHKGKRKYAASELGISERTLYRKIKEYNLTD
jgi:DNA-binding NtrC family response regulator